MPCRAPYGARGLKSLAMRTEKVRINGRAPYGARGLKYGRDLRLDGVAVVAPRMGRVD